MNGCTIICPTIVPEFKDLPQIFVPKCYNSCCSYKDDVLICRLCWDRHFKVSNIRYKLLSQEPFVSDRRKSITNALDRFQISQEDLENIGLLQWIDSYINFCSFHPNIIRLVTRLHLRLIGEDDDIDGDSKILAFLAAIWKYIGYPRRRRKVCI